MISLVLTLALMGAVVAAGAGLLQAGLRAGDRPGDTLVSDVEVSPNGAAVRFIVDNPGHQAVLVGASTRRSTLRALVEGSPFVQVPRRTSHATFAAGRYDVVVAVEAGCADTVWVPVPGDIRRRAELLVAIGEHDRLRVVRHPLDVRRGATVPGAADDGPLPRHAVADVPSDHDLH